MFWLPLTHKGQVRARNEQDRAQNEKVMQDQVRRGDGLQLEHYNYGSVVALPGDRIRLQSWCHVCVHVQKGTVSTETADALRKGAVSLREWEQVISAVFLLLLWTAVYTWRGAGSVKCSSRPECLPTMTFHVISNIPNR